MDRLILQPGAIPLDTDGGSIQRSAMIALGYLMQAVLGTSTVVDGLACTPTSPASMAVNVGPGSVYALSTIDTTAFGSLASDTNPLVKQGVNFEGSTAFTLTAPGTSGQSINYLIEATLQESDGTPVVLPYYNPANPSVPYSGPANSGAAQDTVRTQRAALQMKAGAPATTGTQTTPAVDSGWVGLYVITVAFGASTVTSGNISTHAQTPLLNMRLPKLTVPGAVGSQAYTSHGSHTFTVPAGVYTLEYELWGCGSGGSGGSSIAGGGGGGGAGGYATGILSVSPADTITVTLAQGTAGATNAASAAGSASTLVHGATTITANGGSATGSSGAGPGVGGTASGGQLNIQGGTGGDINEASPTNSGSAVGGAAPRGGSGGSGAGTAGIWPGGGGGADFTGATSGADAGCVLRW